MSLSSSQRVVVIGGTSGIGLAVAQATAATGARVTVASLSDKSVARALEQLPSGVDGAVVDVVSSTSLDSFFAGVGAFDHLVFTAGDDLVESTIGDYDPQQAHDFFDVRLFRALDSVRAALPTLRESGSVILTSGAGAFQRGAGKLLGTTLTNAVIVAARSLAVELAPIRVNVIAPGVARTPLWDYLGDEARDALYRQTADASLLGRVADADDIARAYIGFMEQDYVTGNLAVVDGGRALG